MALDVGAKAPNFSLETDDGGEVSLAGFKGKKVVLYFYPKDDTPGCTKEACAFRDLFPDFRKVKADVVGVSKDSVERHAKFKKKYDLPFTLAADPEGEACEAYGVWKMKSLYGRKFLGIERTTFLIDERGVVRAIWPKVKVDGHADAVMKAIKELS